MKYTKILIFTILLSNSISVKSQTIDDYAGTYKSDTLFFLDSINNLSDSLTMYKYVYDNDSSSGFYVGYNSEFIKVAKIYFNQNINHKVILYDRKGLIKEMIFIINDTIEEHLKFNGRGKLWEMSRFHTNGSKILEILYYKNGRVMVEKNYNRNGFLIQRKSYYKSGNIKSITIAKNDSVANSFFYTRSGKIKN